MDKARHLLDYLQATKAVKVEDKEGRIFILHVSVHTDEEIEQIKKAIKTELEIYDYEV